jgi:NTP pyrophosphatase (non-canonical NTP hydrolase)
MRRGRDRFGELVERQLELFAVDEGELLAEADEAEEAWNRADRDHAEEAYGDYQLVVDAIADSLLGIRETYAATLDEPAADAYRESFNRLASRRFRRHPSIASDLEL